MEMQNSNPQSSIQNLKAKIPILWRSFRISAWLGWQIESNWTDPFLFFVYSVIKPITGAAILVVMYSVITQANFESPMFSYIYLGNAFYIYVGSVMNGIAYAVIDDREHYKTLKYIYTAPIHFPSYLIGRGVASFLVASIAVFITTLVGVLFLHVNVDFTATNWLLLLITLFIGTLMLSMMGLSLAGALLNLAHHVWEIGGVIAGVFLLFSGAVFPLTILPKVLQPIGYIIPITYWLELMRRSLLGPEAQTLITLTNITNLELLGILIGLTILFAMLAMLTFSHLENRARDLGLIDQVTNY
jgi:ABC-2 type transport system permease protein